MVISVKLVHEVRNQELQWNADSARVSAQMPRCKRNLESLFKNAAWLLFLVGTASLVLELRGAALNLSAVISNRM